MATLYEPSGRERTCRPRNGRKFALDELQELIGGYVGIVGIPGDVGGRLFVVDEDGRLKGLGANAKASKLAYRLLLGNALLCSPKEVD